jgi:hypothetical protein
VVVEPKGDVPGLGTLGKLNLNFGGALVVVGDSVIAGVESEGLGMLKPNVVGVGLDGSAGGVELAAGAALFVNPKLNFGG